MKADERQRLLQWLRKYLPLGTKLFFLRIPSNPYSRRYIIFVNRAPYSGDNPAPELENITIRVARLLGFRLGADNTLRTKGSDSADITEALRRTLFPDLFSDEALGMAQVLSGDSSTIEKQRRESLLCFDV